MSALATGNGIPPAPTPIGRLIEQARVSAGQSQYALAERLRSESGNPSVAREYVARWENGRRIPTPYWRQHLSSVLDIPREDLDRAAATALRLRDGNGGHGTDDGSVPRRSANRTAAIVASLTEHDGILPYVEPIGALAALTAFFESDRRVFVLAGPPGAGKSSLVQHLAAGSVETVVQLHDVALWRGQETDLAAEILRYASLDPGPATALTLERSLGQSDTRLTVAIDGIATAVRLDSVARQVDSLLRQVTGPQLRFVLVVRTPPRVELTRYPVLAASVFSAGLPSSAEDHVSLRLGPWGLAEARRTWNAARSEAAPTFDDLPASVRRLVCLPLYQRLALSVSAAAQVPTASGFALVDACVRSVARLDGRDVDSVIGDVAHRVSVTADELPYRFRQAPVAVRQAVAEEFGRLARTSGDGSVVFEHDVVREYFLAIHISDFLLGLGAPAAVAAALDELAEVAQASATVRGAMAFAVQRLDGIASELISDALASSFADPVMTAPLMVEFAGHEATWFSSDVVRSLMFRSISDRSLLLTQTVLTSPMTHLRAGDGMASWVVDALRAFGADVWPSVAAYLAILDAREARRLLDALDLRRDDDAVFLAAHLRWFGGAAADRLPELLAHEDWRIRAALTSVVSTSVSSSPALPVALIVERLVIDRDYKVRAAIASVLPSMSRETTLAHLVALLRDHNWHVRERTLHGLTSGADDGLISRALEHVRNDPAWRTRPASVAVQLSRLELLASYDFQTVTVQDEKYLEQSLFALLREIRTGHQVVSAAVAQRLALRGRRSRNPFLIREANREAPLLSRQEYRGLRGSRAIQVALDVHDVESAQRVALAVASVGVDFIEVGDPLIKRVGLDAIRAVKESCPQVRVVAEMMSADWGRDQVAMAAHAGADAVLLIGPATTASVRAAAQAGLRLGVPVALDVATAHADAAWVRAMESAGVDALAVTTNIDLGVGGRTPLQTAEGIRRWTRLPVLVSGGFSAADRTALTSPEWDVLVIGRSVTEATDPARALGELYETIGRGVSRRSSMVGDAK